MQVVLSNITSTAKENAGANSQISIKGNNDAGIISLITGTGCTGQEIMDVIFTTPFQNGIKVVIIPLNDNAAGLQFVKATAGTGIELFAMDTDTTLTDETLYEFFYEVIELIR